MKRLAFYVLVIGATIAGLILFWQFRSIVMLLFLSLTLTATLRPSVDFLAARGLRPGLARLLVYLAVFGTLILVIAAIIGPLAKELELLSNYLIVRYDSTYRLWSASSGWQQALAARLPATNQLDEALAGPLGASLRQGLFGVSQGTIALLAGLVIVIALSLYWSADRSHFERLWLSLLPAERRIQSRAIWHGTEEALGAYVRSEFIQSFLAFAMLAIGYQLVGMDFPILAGIIAAIAWLIPLVGFVIAAIASFFLGLISIGGLSTAVASLVVTALVLAFLEFMVEPRLFRRQDFSGVLIIAVMVGLVDAYGFAGFIIAPPLAVAIQVFVGYVIRATRQQPVAALQLESLEAQVSDIRALYPVGDEDDPEKAAMPHEIDSLLSRLDGLLNEARDIADQELATNTSSLPAGRNAPSTMRKTGKPGPI